MIIGPGGKHAPLLTLEQVLEPYYEFRDTISAEIVLASPDGGAPVATGSGPLRAGLAERFRSDPIARDALRDTLSLDQIFAEDFHAAYCLCSPEFIMPGQDHPIVRLLQQMAAAGKPVAVVTAESGPGVSVTSASPLLAAKALIGALPDTGFHIH